jgi:hypothetical protein
MRAVITALAAGALIAAPAAAEKTPKEWSPSEKALAKRLAKVGTWEFAALKPGPDGQPECRETWFFKRDGTGWVQSGEERVTLNWRILSSVTWSPDRPFPDRLLYITALASTGQPDCMGNPSDPGSYPQDERGFFVRFTERDSALICGLAEFQHSYDRTKKAPLANGYDDCWGRIAPVANG